MKIAIITGPRVIGAPDGKLVRDVVREVIARGFKIYVGDAVGVDFIAAQECFILARGQNSENFFAERFFPRPVLGHTPAGLAERSTRMVKEALRDYENTQEGFDHGAFREDPHGEIICIGFPNKPCPAGIVPARSWKSGSSGTWSTLALAVGHEIETWIIPLSKIGFPSYDWYEKFGWHGFMHMGNAFIHGWHFMPAPDFFANHRPKFDFFNTVPANALSHDEKANGWTELARANSSDEN